MEIITEMYSWLNKLFLNKLLMELNSFFLNNVTAKKKSVFF